MTPVKDEILFSSFIGPTEDVGTCALVLEKRFEAGGGDAVSLQITAKGVYAAEINGRPVGDFFLAPGWTEYHKRLQVQRYDVTAMLGEKNRLDITVANGWYRRANAQWTHCQYPDEHLPAMLIAAICFVFEDGRQG